MINDECCYFISSKTSSVFTKSLLNLSVCLFFKCLVKAIFKRHSCRTNSYLSSILASLGSLFAFCKRCWSNLLSILFCSFTKRVGIETFFSDNTTIVFVLLLFVLTLGPTHNTLEWYKRQEELTQCDSNESIRQREGRLLSFCRSSSRYRGGCGHHDPWAQRPRGGVPAGAQRDGEHDHHHRDQEPAEVREPDVGRLRVHLLHRADDHLAGLARLLLHPEVPLRQRPRPQPGAQPKPPHIDTQTHNNAAIVIFRLHILKSELE